MTAASTHSAATYVGAQQQRGGGRRAWQRSFPSAQPSIRASYARACAAHQLRTPRHAATSARLEHHQLRAPLPVAAQPLHARGARARVAVGGSPVAAPRATMQLKTLAVLAVAPACALGAQPPRRALSCVAALQPRARARLVPSPAPARRHAQRSDQGVTCRAGPSVRAPSTQSVCRRPCRWVGCACGAAAQRRAGLRIPPPLLAP